MTPSNTFVPVVSCSCAIRCAAHAIESVLPVSEMAQTQGASNVLRTHGILAGIFDTAVRDRSLLTNPARDIAIPRKTKKRKTYLTHAQVELLALNSRDPVLIRFLSYTGLRWGEATGIRVRHLDLMSAGFVSKRTR